MENAVFFHYKTKETFLHKTPPWLKIILILLLSCTAFHLPARACLFLYPATIIFSLIFLNFRISEIYSDQKPVFAYIILLYAATVILNLSKHLVSLHFPLSQWDELFSGAARIFIPDLTYLSLLSHLALAVEITSVFFRTTSYSQFKEGFSTIESFITRKEKTDFSDTLALTLSFIPRISTFWTRLSLAYSARGGKDSLYKALTLFPKLFHLSMREGYEKSLAIQNRN